ncbi:MAG TPA: trehalase family glycosidase [Bacteroidota bacterium]|nr:trehalase family glycosidase [Bacteroidota bacterium]
MNHSFTFLVRALLLVSVCCSLSPSQDRGSHDPRQAERGIYFQRKSYTPAPLPTFAATRALLPSPIDDEDTLLVRLYWKAWELAFRNFHEPAPSSGFVSQFIDAAFNDNIFLWDTAFMTMFCNVAAPIVPGISSLDNFYIKQHPTGEICREIQRSTGLDFVYWVNAEDSTLFSRWGWIFPPAKRGSVAYRGRSAPSPNPRLTLDAMNHPILAWAELESFHFTGNLERLRLIWNPLVHYYDAYQKYLRQGSGLYMTDWASMDNSPRNASLNGGGTGIDISAEMVLFARNLAEIGHLTGHDAEASRYEREAMELADTINRLMWDPDRRFYFDLTVDGSRAKVKTVASYWTLIAGVAAPDQVEALVNELGNPQTFGRLDPVPTCAANEPGYLSIGGYWRGAVWAPTTTMVIRGLERYGYSDLARAIALRHLRIVADVFSETGTIWENYSPDEKKPGRHADSALVARDFVGWSGIAPILYFLEYGIGLKPNAERNELSWRIDSPSRLGCERYRFNGHVVSLVASGRRENGKLKVSVDSDGSFILRIIQGDKEFVWNVKKGQNEFDVP